METSSENSNLIPIVLTTPTSRSALRPRIDSKASGTGEDIRGLEDLQGRSATKVIPGDSDEKRVSASVPVGLAELPSRNTSESWSESAPR